MGSNSRVADSNVPKTGISTRKLSVEHNVSRESTVYLPFLKEKSKKTSVQFK